MVGTTLEHHGFGVLWEGGHNITLIKLNKNQLKIFSYLLNVDALISYLKYHCVKQVNKSKGFSSVYGGDLAGNAMSSRTGLESANG